MFFEQKNNANILEQLLAKQDHAMQELLIRMDVLDREVKGLMNELNVTPEQLTKYIENSDNFTPENWEELQQQRKSLDEKLKRDLENVRDPSKTKKRQADRNVAPHWLFVK